MKFYLKDDKPIFLNKLMYYANVLNNYAEIETAIEHGQVYVDDESVVKKHLLINIGNVVRFRKFHIKVLSLSQKEEFEKEATTNIKHGKVNTWSLKIDSKK
ncbi:MAG: hypothetical protein K8S23_10460 [Candidatus Cloacimonetes bacterium]|nr:hypothetical protein [Candidatus Cloacimonadota bacterium]